MKKILRFIFIFLLFLILSTVYTYAETDYSSLDSYKHSLFELVGSLQTIVNQTEKATNYQTRKEVEQGKEETNILLKREKENVINVIEQYQIMIQKQIKMIDKEVVVNRIRSYEKDKAALINEEVNNEITEYLSEILSNR